MKWFLFATMYLLVACQTPELATGVETVVYDLEPETRSYQDVLKKYLRSDTVFSNYETLYVLNVTAFLPEFQQAFKKMNEERFSELDLLKNIKSAPLFFVSIYSPHDDLNNLSNGKIWEFVLKVGIREFPVKVITKLNDKDTWSSFFPFINRWSSDYLLTFDIPDFDKSGAPDQLSLLLTNARAKTSISWQAR